MKVKVLIPFIRKSTGKLVKKDATFKTDKEELERIQKVNVNMVQVIEE